MTTSQPQSAEVDLVHVRRPTIVPNTTNDFP